MKFQHYVSSLLLFAATQSQAAIIAQQDFEVAPATPTASYTNTGTLSLQSGSTGGTTTPTTSTWGVGTSVGATWTGNGRIDFDAIDTTGYSALSASIRIAALSGTTGNGMDAADSITVSISPDGGTTFYSRIIVTGSSSNNVRWSFTDATGVVSNVYAADNTATTFNPTGTGDLTGANAPTTLTISGLPSVAEFIFRIAASDNSTSENWLVDDFVLTGTPIPEPSTALLGCLGLLGLFRRRR